MRTFSDEDLKNMSNNSEIVKVLRDIGYILAQYYTVKNPNDFRLIEVMQYFDLLLEDKESFNTTGYRIISWDSISEIADRIGFEESESFCYEIDEVQRLKFLCGRGIYDICSDVKLYFKHQKTHYLLGCIANICLYP
jgi:AraC-like DNA-binding protein